MASMRGVKTVREAIPADYHMRSEDETEDAMDESKNSMDESQATESDGSDEEVEVSVQEDIARFEQSFKNISTRFRLINRIGEGAATSLDLILCF
jgi:cell division control protein 7